MPGAIKSLTVFYSDRLVEDAINKAIVFRKNQSKIVNQVIGFET